MGEIMPPIPSPRKINAVGILLGLSTLRLFFEQAAFVVDDVLPAPQQQDRRLP